MTDVLSGVLIAAAGAAVGSFVATAALRTTQGATALFGRSRCDGCRRVLAFAETVPLISFAAMRGGCRSCGWRIHPVHPAGELLGAVGALAVWQLGSWPAGAAIAILGLALLAAAAIDALTRRLPDRLTLVVAAAGATLSAMKGPHVLLAGVAAAALAFGVLMLVRRAFVWSGRDAGLGLGDVKLVSGLALWLGLQTPLMVAMAAAMGLASIALKPPADGRIAFGPMLALAGWAVGVTMEFGLWPR